jgi:hypothetical protein
MEIIEELKEARQQPCDECPFNRRVKPGALGGSDPLRYIGQAEAGFVIPCHKTIDYSDPEWNTKCLGTASQCAGLAIYRANCGINLEQAPANVVIKTMGATPGVQLELPANRELVFASHAEFLSHHVGIPLEVCTELLGSMWQPLITDATKRVMAEGGVQVKAIRSKP